MNDIAGWVAPIATMIAAMMTAANLGARVTGWGFVVFVIGSISWSIIGITSGQTNLLLTNGFLTLVNVVGIWRWLGRQARYDEGGKIAERRSAAASVPTLFSSASMIGSPVLDQQGCSIATVVDAMMSCAASKLSYVVISEGGVAGLGERLHALDPATLQFRPDGICCTLSQEQIEQLPVLDHDRWPAALS